LRICSFALFALQEVTNSTEQMIRGLQLRPKADRGRFCVFYNTSTPSFDLGYRGTLGYYAVFFAARTPTVTT